MRFLDSSIWLDHIANTSKGSVDIVESDMLLFCSILSLFEIKKRLVTLNLNDDKIEGFIDFVKKRAVVINLNEEIVNLAVELAVKNHLAAIDSLIYASALKVGARFVTADNDFRGLKDVEIVGK